MFKTLLATAGALALSTAVTPAVATERDDRPRYEQRYDRGNHYGHYKRDKKRYRHHRRYRDYDYYYWQRYFRSYPSYYRGRCYNNYRTVIVRDPYTGRWVCMPRYQYDRYRLQIRINL